MVKSNDNTSNLQNLGSMVGFLLPILQIFFQFIPDSSINIFLFEDHFLLVSIFSAVVSYALILVIRSFPWFDIPLWFWEHSKFQKHLANLNPNLFSVDEQISYQRKNPYVKRPFYFTPRNLFLILVPLVIISFVIFLNLSFLEKEYAYRWQILMQVFSYICLISSTTLLLANYHIRESNDQKYQQEESSRVQKVIQLAFENKSFEEFPCIRLIAQWKVSDTLPGSHNFVFKVNQRYYILIVDLDTNKILSVDLYETYEALLNQLRSVKQG